MFMGRDMLKIFVLLYCLYIHRASTSLQHLHYPINSCQVGDMIQNECVKCLCTTKSFFECKPVDCNKTKGLEEFKVESKQTCIPNQLYIQNLITCICNKDGTWPHRNCLETFLSLPSTNIKKHTCEPNTYVKIDCNVCRCGPDGNVIQDRCTKNICEEKPSRRIDMEDDSKQSSVYSSCILRNWYSLAPCQFCYCLNENKLVCNTGHYYAKKLEVGKYNMEICGTDMINEVMELIPEEQKYLRQGTAYDSNVLTTTAQETTTTETISIQNNNDLMNRNEYKHNSDNEKQSDDEGHTSGTDEKQDETSSEESDKTDNSPPGMIDMGKNVKPNTKLGNSDETASYDDDSNDEDSKADNSNENGVDITRSKGKESSRSESINKNSKNQRPSTKQTFEDLEFVDNTLKINVPNVLNKVFEMALRKSMVSLNNETHCTPGATYMHSCNMCFCLKNGKELCTANKCPSKS